LPNVEVVTLLCGLYGYVFGWLGVLAALVFVCIEPLIWGVNTWVVLYFVYWPLVAFVFMLFGKIKLKNRWIITLTAVVLTVFFGLLSSFIDIGLFSGYFDNFFYRFSVYYLRGLPFYLAQIATNAVVFPLLFLFISQKLQKLSAAFR
jgi:energy-coupling factor transport system substrate-specific component/cob(I)alamin adenosyltransferase